MQRPLQNAAHQLQRGMLFQCYTTPYHLVSRAAVSFVCTTTDTLMVEHMGTVIALVKRSCGNESHARGFDVIAF